VCCLVMPRIMSDEKRLIKQLLSKYQEVGVVGRPVFNQSDTIQVNYGLQLIQILEMDEKNQVLTTNVWSRYVSYSSYLLTTCCGLATTNSMSAVGQKDISPLVRGIVKCHRNSLWPITFQGRGKPGLGGQLTP